MTPEIISPHTLFIASMYIVSVCLCAMAVLGNGYAPWWLKALQLKASIFYLSMGLFWSKLIPVWMVIVTAVILAAAIIPISFVYIRMFWRHREKR